MVKETAPIATLKFLSTDLIYLNNFLPLANWVGMMLLVVQLWSANRWTWTIDRQPSLLMTMLILKSCLINHIVMLLTKKIIKLIQHQGNQKKKFRKKNWFFFASYRLDIYSRFVTQSIVVFRKSTDKTTDGYNKVPENGVTGGQFKKPPVAPPADKGRQSLREQDQLPVGYLDAFG